MAVGTNSDFQIFDRQFHGAFIETSQQRAQELLQGGPGAFTFRPRNHRGNLLEESLFLDQGGIVSRRDPTTDGSATATKLSQDKDVKVKLDRRVGPMEQMIDSFQKTEVEGQEAAMAQLGRVVGAQAAQDGFEDMVNRAIGAAVSALENEGSNDLNEGSTGTMETKFLARVLKKMGDQSQRVIAWVMHPNAFFDLLEDQIVNGPTTDNVAGFAVAEGSPVTLGRPVIVTESSELVETDGVSSGTDEHRTLGLTEDALRIFESQDRIVHNEVVGGDDNLKIRFQAEYAWTLGFRGFKWSGGTNPTNSAVATGSNWTSWASDSKSFGGVLLRTQ